MQSTPSFSACALSAFVAFAMALTLAACSSKEPNVIVDSSPESITIQYDTRYPTMAGVDADEHCAKYGKLAVRSETEKPGRMEDVTEPYAAIAVFDCVGRR